MLGKLDVKIIRDIAKNPSLVIINKDNRKITVEYDGDNMIFRGDDSLFPSVPEVLQIAYPYELESNSRPFWYDRNPLTVAEGYANTLAPHGNTERVSYIVPENRKCMIELIFTRIYRVTAAAPIGQYLAEWYLTPAGKAQADLFSLPMYTNNVGDIDRAILGQTLTLNAGDRIHANTRDLSTGGTVNYQLHFKGVLFDE